ncbi:MAG: 50S ribosomal protein L31e [Candidatus Woesearchaeota archaeon]
MVNETRTYNIPLRREYMKAPKYKRSKRAVSAVRQFLSRHMKSDSISISKDLNEHIWEKGIKNPPHHVKVTAVKDNDGKVTVDLSEKKMGKAERLRAEKEKKSVEKADKAKKKKEEKLEEEIAESEKELEETKDNESSSEKSEEKPEDKETNAPKKDVTPVKKDEPETIVDEKKSNVPKDNNDKEVVKTEPDNK